MSSQYTKLLDGFKRIGYSQNSTLQQYQINKALDKIGGNGFQFDRDVAQQLWDHTNKSNGNTVMLRDYIQTIVEAQNVLKEHINTTEGKIYTYMKIKYIDKLKYEKDPANIQQLQADLLSYVNDHKILTQPFKLPTLPQSHAVTESRANFAASSRQQSFNGGASNLDIGWARTSQIFSMVPSQRQQSWSLKIVLIFTIILFGLEIVIMFHKNHFFNLIGYVLILLIFVQNYFDKLYMRVTIIWVVLSVLLDFLWLIVHAEVIYKIIQKNIQNWWNPYPQTQHGTVQTGYLRFSYFMVICTMIAKVLVVILTIRYFNNDEAIRKSVTIFKLSFKLDGRSQNNPFTMALTGQSQGYNEANNAGDRYNFEA